MGLPKPKIEQFGGSFHITIFRRNKTSVPVNVPVKASLAEQIYALVKEHPGLNRVTIAEIIGVDVRTVKRQVSALRGRIEFRGAPKTGGYWEVKAINS